MIHIDLEAGEVIDDGTEPPSRLALGSPEAFALISRVWLRATWESRYVYSFSWLGRPIIQLPDDLLRLQEVVYALKPDVIIETGVAHGGGQVFLAGLCKLIGRGHVIGIDVEIRPANRKALEEHELKPLISLFEGSSTDPAVVEQVRASILKEDKVLVILDSNHTKDHVLAELEAYCDFVSVGSYIIVADGIMEELSRAPRGKPDWRWNNPKAAAAEFIATHPEFEILVPVPPFNEGPELSPVTHWPSGYLRRIK